MKNQKQMEKMWAKIILNSYYGFPPISVFSTIYNKSTANNITEESRKIQEKLNEILNK